MEHLDGLRRPHRHRHNLGAELLLELDRPPQPTPVERIDLVRHAFADNRAGLRVEANIFDARNLLGADHNLHQDLRSLLRTDSGRVGRVRFVFMFRRLADPRQEKPARDLRRRLTSASRCLGRRMILMWGECAMQRTPTSPPCARRPERSIPSRPLANGGPRRFGNSRAASFRARYWSTLRPIRVISPIAIMSSTPTADESPISPDCQLSHINSEITRLPASTASAPWSGLHGVQPTNTQPDTMAGNSSGSTM